MCQTFPSFCEEGEKPSTCNANRGFQSFRSIYDQSNAREPILKVKGSYKFVSLKTQFVPWNYICKILTSVKYYLENLFITFFSNSVLYCAVYYLFTKCVLFIFIYFTFNLTFIYFNSYNNISFFYFNLIFILYIFIIIISTVFLLNISRDPLPPPCGPWGS